MPTLWRKTTDGHVRVIQYTAQMTEDGYNLLVENIRFHVGRLLYLPLSDPRRRMGNNQSPARMHEFSVTTKDSDKVRAEELCAMYEIIEEIKEALRRGDPP